MARRHRATALGCDAAELACRLIPLLLSLDQCLQTLIAAGACRVDKTRRHFRRGNPRTTEYDDGGANTPVPETQIRFRILQRETHAAHFLAQ